MPKPKIDRIGRRYGRLSVIDTIYIRGLGTGWKCQCDCGEVTYVTGRNLDSGNTTSCGCFFREQKRTHGHTHSRIYGIWKSMMQRCRNPNSNGYWNYGGRGIEVCERWDAFENFLADMGYPPDGHTLERIDNSLGYGPHNCRWATYKEQLNNRRNNHMVEAFGKRQTMTQWAEEYGFSVTTLKNRIYRAGMTPEEALSAPIQQGYKFSTNFAKAEDAIARRWAK